MSDSTLTRRSVLACFGACLAAAAGCSSDSKDSGAAAATSPTPSAPASSAAASSSAATGSGSGTATALAKVADIPDGSAIVVDAPDGSSIVLSRTGTQVHAFDAHCTHQGTIVQPDGAKLHCPNHGSNFDAATAKVLNGPAAVPLKSVAIQVSNGEVLRA